MARGRPHGRSKSDHRVCQAARHARAAEYRERIAISAEQQEARIAAVNAECNVEDAPWRRRRQESRKLKVKAGAARVSAGGPSCKASGSAAKKAKKGLEHSLGKAAERDLHSLHCHACGATADFGLRGSKEGGSVKYSCRVHTTSKGCFRVDRDRAAWVEDQEMRRLRAQERRLKEELRNLGGTSYAAEPSAEQPSAPPCASAPWSEFQSTRDCVSMPMSRSLIVTLLMIGAIESNPGPPLPSELEEIANCKRSWQEADSQISSTLLAHLAQQKVNFAHWERSSREDRLEDIRELKKAFEAEDGGRWAPGWTTFLREARGPVKRGQDAGAGQSKDVDMLDADHENQNREGAPQELVDFWRALPDAAWSDDRKVMTLADGTSFLGHEGLGNKLYLRDCYPALQKEVQDLFAEEDGHQRKKNRAVVIIGIPGIGKSLFGYLLLYQWATEDPPRDVVVVKRGYCPMATLLTTAGCFELDKKALAEQLGRPEVRYLVDGLNPMDVGRLPTRAQMVLVTSPNPDVYHEAWKSVGYRHRYMDVWSWEEVDECREGVFPDLDPDEVKARYDRWGGIPRYVLEKVDSDAQRLLKKAITSTPLKALQESVGEQAAPSETSHKLLHLRVGADFETTWMEMASLYVAEKVAYQLWKNEKESLRLFLSSSEGEGSVGALRGNLWEGFCHARLIEGGLFEIRDLSDPLKRVQEKHLPCSSSGQALAPLIFDNWKDIQGKPHGRYLRPRSKTNESVDSGMQPNILFQITVSKRHDLKPGGMKRALEFLEQNGPGAVELYFALPSDAFMRFSRTEIKPAAVNNAVKQFALEVSF
eukprot:TRINITY_DN334_c0_g2_i7.p1 TRINITY_DN334_c0_g2~~TRINITY_DN334_c0_g2_i7.p1  ORF type:complete len:819 (-),score=169.67 TRINITY_DN334_c0_g2_i7:435-2891(-)